jgi:hypothetical protein
MRNSYKILARKHEGKKKTLGRRKLNGEITLKLALGKQCWRM